jgi:putative ABC transport system substrate-binding protein
MKSRRDFITLLGGAVAWPVAARGQQPERMRRVSVFMDLAEEDAEGQARVAAFRKGLQELGWIEGRNVKLDYRWTAADPNRMRRYAAELVSLAPEVIMNGGLPTLVAMQQETRTIPIVFAQVLDPVGAGFVESLARPGGNITGFVSFEYSMAGKWLDTLTHIAPRTRRIAAVRDLASPSEMGMLGAIQAVLPSFSLPFVVIGGRDAAEFERAIEGFAREPNGALIVLPSPNTLVQRRTIMAMAARHSLPAIYPYGFFAREGGLISYGIVPSDNFRRAASYVDRILKGANRRLVSRHCSRDWKSSDGKSVATCGSTIAGQRPIPIARARVLRSCCGCHLMRCWGTAARGRRRCCGQHDRFRSYLFSLVILSLLDWCRALRGQLGMPLASPRTSRQSGLNCWNFSWRLRRASDASPSYSTLRPAHLASR